MEKVKTIANREDAIKILTVALEHEWAVSFEYIIHAYSMPKGKYFYQDPIMGFRTDVRAQTIQIGIDEMYHAQQLALVLRQMGLVPSFKTDEVIRFPRVLDNLKRDKRTEDLVTDLYQSARFVEGSFPEVHNMLLNISYDEVRHGRQFQTMIETMTGEGAGDVVSFKPDPQAEQKEDVRLLHELTRLENEVVHRYLYYSYLFSAHQDLGARLFKNSIDHMRHWDKNSGMLVKLGSVIRIENAEIQPDGSERSLKPMPDIYPGTDRLSALETLVPAEDRLIALYEKAVALVAAGEMRDQLNFHLAQNREHRFTQEWLLANARRVPNLK
jgi:bacterioferritin (cytochrome b1)